MHLRIGVFITITTGGIIEYVIKLHVLNTSIKFHILSMINCLIGKMFTMWVFDCHRYVIQNI